MAMQLKVNVTHGGTSTDYLPDPFTSIQIKRRENNYDTATLQFADRNSYFYEDSFDHFDEVKIYLKQSWESTWTQVFGGWARQVNPTLNSQGVMPALICKGYGMALEETHCNRDYGVEAKATGYPHVNNIVGNAIADFVNLSFDNTNTGWAIDNSNISTYLDGTDVKYMNNPYRTNLEVIDLACEIGSAIGAGATAGPHWIVDCSKNFLFEKIGDHAAGGSDPEALWPTWWKTNAAGSLLEQERDFTEYVITDKNEEFANKVVLITDFRRPSYDYWTESAGGGGATLWTNDALDGITDDNAAGHFVVGADSVKFDPNGAVTGYGYFPAADANWDIEKWGSVRTIPTLNFYCWKHLLTTATTYVRLSTNDTARKTDYYYATFLNWATEPDDTWLHKSIPIGPYWATTQEAREYRWSWAGSPDWNNIDTIEFVITGAGAGGYLLVDDLHFAGKIARSAYNSYSILGNVAAPVVAAKNEYQKVLVSRNAMDDSCVAGDDTGFAARIVYAELLRRQKRPKTITFATPTDMKSAMAGQLIHVHACKRPDGTFRSSGWDNGGDMRILELQINFEALSGCIFTVTATTDLLNSVPISVPDQYSMWMENMFLNSKEAKNIRTGAEVDLLIPLIERDYPSDDD